MCLLSVDRLMKSLAQVVPLYKGEDGQPGGSKNCYGRNGSITYILVCVCICFLKCIWSTHAFIDIYRIPNAFPSLYVCLQVPIGTVVKEEGTMVADLSQHGQEYLAVFGGTGGKGNRFYLSNENRAPMTTTPGIPGQERRLQLELRTMAHAGLVSTQVL